MRTVKESLVQSLKEILVKSHKFPTRATSREHLQFLLRQLHPVSVEEKLVRLGPNGDGGYLVPDDLKNIDACFSPGVSFVSGFEKDCADLGMEVFLADKSVDKPSEQHELFHFTKKFIGAVSNNDFMTLDDWVSNSLSEKKSDLLLQMDIEGYEYEVFLCTPESLMRRFRGIVVEFHNLGQLWSRPFFNLARRSFEKILQTHSCIHIHPNNCCGSSRINGLDIPDVMEFTFWRSDRIAGNTYVKGFPNPLDYDNTEDATLVLPQCWYRGAQD